MSYLYRDMCIFLYTYVICMYTYIHMYLVSLRTALRLSAAYMPILILGVPPSMLKLGGALSVSAYLESQVARKNRPLYQSNPEYIESSP